MRPPARGRPAESGGHRSAGTPRAGRLAAQRRAGAPGGPRAAPRGWSASRLLRPPSLRFQITVSVRLSCKAQETLSGPIKSFTMLLGISLRNTGRHFLSLCVFCFIFKMDYLFERARAHGWDGQREREARAESREPRGEAGPDPRTLRSGTERKPRARGLPCLTDCASHAPSCLLLSADLFTSFPACLQNESCRAYECFYSVFLDLTLFLVPSRSIVSGINDSCPESPLSPPFPPPSNSPLWK